MPKTVKHDFRLGKCEMSRTAKTVTGWICGLVILTVGLVASFSDDAKHEQQEQIRHDVETVREMETVPFATVTPTTLSPYIGPNR